MSQGRKILVTGASGQLGRKLVRKLVNEGYRVRAQYRSEKQAKRWNPDGVEIVYGDLLEEGWLDEATSGCDAVIHCAAWVSMRQVDGELMYRVNVEGTEKIARACHDSESVKRLVHVSSVAAVGGSGDGVPLTETAKFNLLKYDIPYFTTKYYAEKKAFEYNDKNLEVIAVNPSIMISPPDREVTMSDLAKVPKRIPFYIDFGINVVNTYDVVDGIILALEKGRKGNRYILGGEDIDQQTAFDLSDYYLGIRKPFFKIPYPLLLTIGVLSSGFWRVRRLFNRKAPAPRLSLNFIRLAKYRFFFDSYKAKGELGYSPRPLNVTIEEILPQINDPTISDYYKRSPKKEPQSL